MKKEDWFIILRWMGWVYLPIAILVVGIFILVEYRAHKATSDFSTYGPTDTIPAIHPSE